MANTIRRLLHPRSIAVIGASDDETKWGGRFMGYLRKHPPPGPVYPINPKAGSIFGLPVFPSVSACPGPVDMAVLLLPRQHTPAALADCAAKGVQCVIAITAGYAESGAEGKAAQDRMIAEARAAGMRIVGPNCMGLMNTHHNLAATTGVVIGLVDELPKGGIGIVSQSGALMGAMLARGVDMGAGFSSTISVGNQADLSINDFFEYLIEDPKTEVICLYIEEVREPARFSGLLGRARLAGKPVLVLKAGRTAAGAEAVSSHTASLAGPYAVFEAVCRAQGVLLFESPFDMIQGAMLMGRRPEMTSSAIAVFSGSGGGNALLVDQLESVGLTLASLSEASRAALAPYLGESGATLPVDLASLSAHSTKGSPLEEVLDTVMQDPNVGAGVMYMTTQPNMGFVARALHAASRKTRKPLIFVQAGSSAGQAARDSMREVGYGFTESPHEALALLKSLNDQRSFPYNVPPSDPTESPASLEARGYLNEVRTRELLELHGIPTISWRLAQDADQAVRAARDIGYPVVIKAVSGVVVHKSDHGLVKVRLTDEASVRRAFESLRQGMIDLKAPFEGVLVTALVEIDFELLVGIKVDDGFGPMVMVGAGGVLVEVLKDTALAPAPLTADQAEAMVSSLKCLPLLKGYRGRAGADMRQLTDLLVRLSQLAWAYRHCITELDINPLALAAGRLVVLDARASFKD